MPSLFSTRRSESPAPVSRITSERRASRRESSNSVDTVDFQSRLRSFLGEGSSNKGLFRKRSSDLLRASSPSANTTRSMSRGSVRTAVFSETDMETSDAETDEAVATPPGPGETKTTTRIKIPLSQDPEEAMAAAFVMGPASLTPFLEPEAPARASTDETSKEKREAPASAVRPGYAASIISQDGRRPSTATTASVASTSEGIARHPSKTSLVLQSAPMPLPIANLPTLTPTSTHPPEWGSLARDGGPKSPALSRVNSRSSVHGTFPFFTSMSAASSPTTGTRPTPTRELTDKEVRKATRSMPVMTRMPTSRADDEDEDDGGEAEEDDDDADTSSQESPPLPSEEDDHISFTPKGKAPAAGTMTPVAEEPPSSSSTGSSIADRRHAQPMTVDQIRAAASSSNMVLGSTSAKSVWNLATPRPEYSASAGEWATFTESPLKTATISSEAAASSARIPGYFDSPVPSSSRTPTESAVEATPRASDLQRPVVTPRNRSGQIHPARSDPALRSSPVEEEDSETSSDVTTDDEAAGSGSGSSTAPRSSKTPTAPVPTTASNRPPLYSRASQSMVNLSLRESTSGRPESTASNDDEISGVSAETSSPPESVIYTPPTPTAPLRGQSAPPPMKRRMSLEDVPPPRYQTMAFYDGPAPKPREEEGRERLPPYWCGVHIEGTLARKMEFNAPGVQAKDRSWKKHYFVLHGTALYVYKFDPTKVPLRSGEVYLTASNEEVESHLHVHLPPDRVLQERRASMSTTSPTTATSAAARAASPAGRRGTGSSTDSAMPRGAALQNRRLTNGSSSRPSTESTGSDVKDINLFTQKSRRQSSGADSVASSTASAPIAAHLPFAHNQLIHVYSLHNAESGLAADYKKRLHCVRVRSEGQQFMLQTESARQCVQWIEAFQAATNVAMDLDVRPMPVQQTLPRRRRRRNPAAQAAAAAAAQVNGGATPEPDTPEGNAALVAAAERRDRDRDRMLAEDQAAHHANTAIMS